MAKAEQVSLLLLLSCFQCWRHVEESVPGQAHRGGEGGETRELPPRAPALDSLCRGVMCVCVGGVVGIPPGAPGQRSWHEDASPALPLWE